jgi:hypothetical protein
MPNIQIQFVSNAGGQNLYMFDRDLDHLGISREPIRYSGGGIYILNRDYNLDKKCLFNHVNINLDQSRIVLWSPVERLIFSGVEHDTAFDYIHDELNSRALDPRNFLLVVNDRRIETELLEWKLKRRGTKLTGQFVRSIRTAYYDTSEFIVREMAKVDAFEFTESVPQKTFLMLMRNERPHRTALYIRLYEEGLLGNARYSIRGIEKIATWKCAHFGISAEQLSEALGYFKPIALDDSTSRQKCESLEFPRSFYDSTWFSLVTETWCAESGLTITEKVWKAIAMGHPFIVWGQHGILSELRRLGYRTFGNAFNESYDNEPNPRLRLEMIVHEVKRLSKMTQSETDILRPLTRPVAVFNRQHLLTRSHGTEINFVRGLFTDEYWVDRIFNCDAYDES